MRTILGRALVVAGALVAVALAAVPLAAALDDGGWMVAEDDAAQTIEVGHAPLPLEVLARSGSGDWFPYPSAVWRVAGGVLPPGVELLADGTFRGAATTTGRYAATIEACRPGTEPARCDTALLSVLVITPSVVPSGGVWGAAVTTSATVTTVSGGTPQLPRTGASSAALVAVAAVSIALGATLARVAHPHPRFGQRSSSSRDTCPDASGAGRVTGAGGGAWYGRSCPSTSP